MTSYRPLMRMRRTRTTRPEPCGHRFAGSQPDESRNPGTTEKSEEERGSRHAAEPQVNGHKQGTVLQERRGRVNCVRRLETWNDRAEPRGLA